MNREPVRHIFLSSGDPSGDRYGAALAKALYALDPELRISGLGGPEMASAGVDMVCDSSEIAVMGFTEVLKALPDVLDVRRRLTHHLKTENVDLFVPIDFPGFNGNLAGRCRRMGIEVFWLIAPQVWAWGRWRIPSLRRKINRLGTILPFEPEFFEKRGFDVFPMGHPLMADYSGTFSFEEDVTAREKRFNMREGPLTVGILPGSRKQELAELLPILKVTSQAITGYLGQRDVRFVVSCAPSLDPLLINSVFEGGAEISHEPLPKLLSRLDLALVCSGTASLEVALAGVPHELVYCTGWLNYLIGRMMIRTNFIGLSNLIMKKQLVREYLQEQVAPLPLSRGLLRWLARPAERQTYYAEVRSLRKLCDQGDVWPRTARELLNRNENSPFPDRNAD